jgi:hypothetical protein
MYFYFPSIHLFSLHILCSHTVHTQIPSLLLFGNDHANKYFLLGRLPDSSQKHASYQNETSRLDCVQIVHVLHEREDEKKGESVVAILNFVPEFRKTVVPFSLDSFKPKMKSLQSFETSVCITNWHRITSRKAWMFTHTAVRPTKLARIYGCSA